MPLTDLLLSGLELLALGMGVVFFFLGILVVALKGMSALFASEPEAVPAARRPVAVPPSPADEHIPVVIAAALTRYRHGNGRSGA